MAKLYVVGDSFVSTEHTKDTDRDWISLLANKLGVDEVCNNGVLGGSQDFAIHSMQVFEDQITPDDYVLVVLTHPSRFWFFQDEPSVCKANHIEHFAGKFGQMRVDAAQLYVQYIQREQLDTLHVESRLGWLSYNAKFRKWRTPLVVYAMDPVVAPQFNYDLIFSKGSLTENISIPEVKDIKTVDDYYAVIQYLDPRYNHMCLRNHSILADKVYNTFATGAVLDLTTGFENNFLTNELINDAEFQAKELSLAAVEFRNNSLQIAKQEYRTWKIKSLFKF